MDTCCVCNRRLPKDAALVVSASPVRMAPNTSPIRAIGGSTSVRMPAGP